MSPVTVTSPCNYMLKSPTGTATGLTWMPWHPPSAPPHKRGLFPGLRFIAVIYQRGFQRGKACLVGMREYPTQTYNWAGPPCGLRHFVRRGREGRSLLYDLAPLPLTEIRLKVYKNESRSGGMAYATVSKTVGGNPLPVRIRPSAGIIARPRKPGSRRFANRYYRTTIADPSGCRGTTKPSSNRLAAAP